MSYAVRLSDTAESNLEAQVLWYCSDDQRGGEGLGIRWLSLLHAALASLGKHPERYGFAPENGKWQQSLSIRQMVFRPWKSSAGWRVLYVIDEPALTVTVLQLRHEHRPWLVDEEANDG